MVRPMGLKCNTPSYLNSSTDPQHHGNTRTETASSAACSSLNSQAAGPAAFSRTGGGVALRAHALEPRWEAGCSGSATDVQHAAYELMRAPPCACCS